MINLEVNNEQKVIIMGGWMDVWINGWLLKQSKEPWSQGVSIQEASDPQSQETREQVSREAGKQGSREADKQGPGNEKTESQGDRETEGEGIKESGRQRATEPGTYGPMGTRS